MKTQKNKINYKKIFLLLFITLFCGVLIYGTVAKYRSFWPFLKIESTKDNLNYLDSVNYNPPTKEEVSEGQEAKERIINTDNDNLEKVSVGIAFADTVDQKLEIRAFISGVIEGGGICTATLIKDGVSIEESSQAFIDFKTSQCHPIYISIDSFKTKGSWLLTVSYKSETSNGKSESLEVKI